MKHICIIALTVWLFAACNNKTINDNPIVVLTFDDAEISHLTTAAPILKKFGYTATFFVCDRARKKEEKENRYMNWSHIKELNDMGFEIGNHTAHHKNVTKLTREQLIEEVGYIEKKCKENGIPHPVSFAYPGNINDSTSQAILAELGYKYARAGSSRLYNPKEDNVMAVPSYTTLDASERIKNRVSMALKQLQNGQFLILTFHGINSEVNPKYSTSTSYFTELLNYMYDNDFNVIAMRDLDKYVKK